MLSIDECCPANIIHCWLPTQMVESRFNTCLKIHFSPSSSIECTAVFVQSPYLWSSPFFPRNYDIIWHYKGLNGLTIINYMWLSMFPHIIGLTSQQTSQHWSRPSRLPQLRGRTYSIAATWRKSTWTWSCPTGMKAPDLVLGWYWDRPQVHMVLGWEN